MEIIPAEVEIFGTYFPPLLLSVILAIIGMLATVKLLNHYRLSRFFYYPNVVMLALTIIYTAILGTFVFPS